MVYINIPYVPENDTIDKDLAMREIEPLAISDEAKWEAYKAIYHLQPRGVAFEDITEALQLESVLQKLGVPYRQTETSEFTGTR
jgi:hypothetical protein